jgi:hypothetical protein
MGAHLAHLPQYTGPARQVGLEPGFPGRQLCPGKKATVFEVKSAEDQDPRFVDV